MSKFAKRLGFAVLFATVALPAFAADLPEATPEPEAATPVVEQTTYNGWYIRGDADYHWSKFGGATYTTYGAPGGYNTFDSGKLKGALSLGAGVGYQITNHLRTDVTGDYFFKADFRGSTSGTGCGGVPGACTSTEVGKMSAFMLLANAYADLGTYNGFTPYIGAGIGGAHVKWGDLHDPNTTEFNPGSNNWRFAYALMAGVSYCLTDKLAVDGGYRYSHIQGGQMFKYDPSSAGPGYDKGMDVHEVRAGLRYSFGGNSNCAAPQTASYEPAPVYKQ